ncbi:TIGR01459 family HAD-type hydrolase [Breoghania sp. L-A4]|uniref:TIGR01459 family HAD-type hydrolase n=1 Tax=Breoghania sp. L-A4 TaxID=2304600 RepID=UPI000E35FEFA|nr:TIGR01459 family HAD-type hydrolase [Breoghania sp. L-A4]AXS39447.1 TIGR01459 family HAD-type hydrolase [Breoghania sp. L-A4]
MKFADESLFVPGLSAIADGYKGILCDVWGVIHNGLAVHQGAYEALSRFRSETGGRVVLITNAPRPAGPIHKQLAELGLGRDAYDAIVTSGDVTRALLLGTGVSKIIHIGPDRDLSLYEGTGIALVEDPAEAGMIVCTGLVDDITETPEDYHDRLRRLAGHGLTMVCANPDIVVERGDALFWCAGALARDYATFGGKVSILGKPYAPIYETALAELAALVGETVPRDKVLAIGDGLPTDIKGAFDQDLDVLFVTAGIHTADFGEAEAPDPVKVRARLEAEGLNVRAAMPRLAW